MLPQRPFAKQIRSGRLVMHGGPIVNLTGISYTLLLLPAAGFIWMLQLRGEAGVKQHVPLHSSKTNKEKFTNFVTVGGGVLVNSSPWDFQFISGLIGSGFGGAVHFPPHNLGTRLRPKNVPN